MNPTTLCWTVVFIAATTVEVTACEHDAAVRREAVAAGVPARVAVDIMHAESSGNRLAVGPGGERGLFQITPQLWRESGRGPFTNAFKAKENIRVGIRHLARVKSQDPRNFVAWHNAGRKNWRRISKAWTTSHPNRIYRAIYRGSR